MPPTKKRDFNEVLEQRAAGDFAGEVTRLVDVFLESLSEVAANPEGLTGGNVKDLLRRNLGQYTTALGNLLEDLSPGPADDASDTEKRRIPVEKGTEAGAIDRLTDQLMRTAGIPWEKAYPQAVDIVASRRPRPEPVPQLQKSAAGQSVEGAAHALMAQNPGLDEPGAMAKVFETRPELVSAWRAEQMGVAG